MVAAADVDGGGGAAGLGAGQDGVVSLQGLLGGLLVGHAVQHEVHPADDLDIAKGVELDVADPVPEQGVDLGLIDGDDVVHIGLDGRIDLVGHPLDIEVQVHGRGRQAGLERHARVPGQERRLRAAQALARLQLAGADDRLHRHLGVGDLLARPVPEGREARLVLAHEAVAGVGQVGEPAQPPELPVGGHVDAGVPLQLQHVEDGLVLDLVQGLLGHLAPVVRLPGVEQGLGTQETADMVGAVGRGHGRPSWLRPTSAGVAR